MAVKASIEQFDQGDFAEYQDRLHFFLFANDIGTVPSGASTAQKELAEKKKAAYLVSLLSKTAYTTLRTLCLPDEVKDKKFNDLCKLLSKHFKVEKSSTTATFEFRQCVQGVSESCTEYSHRLQRLAVDCKFDVFLDRALKDQFLTGLRRVDMKKKILTAPANQTSSFSEVFQLALTEERADKFVQQLQTSFPPTETVNKVQRPGFKGNPTSRSKHTTTGSTRRCYRCNSDVHLADKCPHKSTTCGYCKKVGHLERICRSKQRHQVHMVGHDDPPTSPGEIDSDFEFAEESIHVIIKSGGPKSCHPPYTVLAEVNHSPLNVNFELDTGSAVTLISIADFEKLGSAISELSVPTVRLVGFSGTQINCLGEGTFPVTMNGQSHNALLRVVDSKGPSLLGRDLLSVFQLPWREIFSVRTAIEEALTQAEIREEMLAKFPELFDSSAVGKLKSMKITLRVNDEHPVYMKARTLPFPIKDAYEESLDKLESEGIIRKVECSPWASPTVPVRKPNGSIRICADYSRTINAHSELERYPLPTIEEIRAKLNGGQKFTTLDLSQAYHQLELDEKSRVYTTISTHRGLYEYVRLPFGIHSAVSIFQRTMETILAGLECCIVYVDDILITGRNDEEHKTNLERVLQRLQQAGMRLNPEKSQFMQSQITYLGHTLTAHGISPSPDKVEAMMQAKPPTSVHELQSFIGSANYVRKFVPKFASIMAPLYTLLKKEALWKWTETEQGAFTTIKKALCSTEVLAYYSTANEHVLQTDASGSGLGAVLLQLETGGERRPIAYASRTLSSAEQKYSNIERESLAVIYGVTKFRQYLLGKKFTVETDHRPLVKLLGQNEEIPSLVSSRLKRFKLKLSAYDYSICYIAGKSNVVADFMSRKPIPGPQILEDLEEASVLFIEDEVLDARTIAAETQKDPVLKKALHFTVHGWPSSVNDPSLQPYFLKRWELSATDDILLWNERVVIPISVRPLLLNELHSEHTGTVRMKRIARRYFWWPRIDDEIDEATRQCAACQAQARRPSKSYATWTWPSGPWRRLHIDFAGPFLGKMFLVVVDAYSKFLEVVPMSTATSAGTIKALRRLFAMFGLPVHIVSDNGTQFTSSEFESFLGKNGIAHTCTAPGHPETNGLAERYVGHFKSKMKVLVQSADLDTCLQRFLLTYRSTPTSNGKSPAELLMGRQPRLKFDALKAKSQLEVRSFNQNAHLTPEYKPGDAVFAISFRKSEPTWVPGIILSVCSPMNFNVQVEDVVWKRHRNQLRHRSVRLSQLAEDCRVEQSRVPPDPTPVPELQNSLDVPAVNDPAPQTRQTTILSGPPTTLPKPSVPSETQSETPSPKTDACVTRSGRRVCTPERYK